MLGPAPNDVSGWTQPLPRPPQLHLATPGAAEDDVMQDVQDAGGRPTSGRAFASRSSNAGQAKPLPCNRQTMGKADQQLDTADCDMADTKAVGANASSLAARLHCMQADAKDRAWQRQKVPGIARTTVALAHAAVHATTGADAKPVLGTLGVNQGHADIASHHGTVSTSVARQHAVSRQNPWTQHAEAGLRQAGCAGANALTAACAASAMPANCAQASAVECQPAPLRRPAVDEHHASTADSTTKGDLSADTESLVAKLRALSQGRGDPTSSKGPNADRHQHHRFPFASRTTNSSQPSDRSKSGMTADPPGVPVPKRCKQSGTQAVGNTAAPGRKTDAAATAGPANQPRPDNASCITLMDPVHSGTSPDAGASPQRRSHRLRSRAGSNTGPAH